VNQRLILAAFHLTLNKMNPLLRNKKELLISTSLRYRSTICKVLQTNLEMKATKKTKQSNKIYISNIMNTRSKL